MCTQCRECFYGSNCLLIERDIWFSWYKEPSTNSCLENTSADNTVSWLVNKNWCWYWTGCSCMNDTANKGLAQWTDGKTCIRSPTAASFWQVYDEHWSWLSDYRCLGTVSLFLFVNHCQEQGYSRCTTASMVNAAWCSGVSTL